MKTTYEEALKILDTQIAEYERGDNDRPGNADVVAGVIESLESLSILTCKISVTSV